MHVWTDDERGEDKESKHLDFFENMFDQGEYTHSWLAIA